MGFLYTVANIDFRNTVETTSMVLRGSFHGALQVKDAPLGPKFYFSHFYVVFPWNPVEDFCSTCEQKNENLSKGLRGVQQKDCHGVQRKVVCSVLWGLASIS